MSEPSQQVHARDPGWRFILGTSCAGVLAFAAAAFLTLVLREASSVSAQPTPSAARAPQPVAAGTAPVVAQHGSGSNVQDASLAATPLERLRGGVRHDPFAALSGGAPLPAVAASMRAPKPGPVAKAAVTVAVAPALSPTASAPPTAPPLPFVALGAIEGAQVTGGQPVAFIRQQEQLLVVRAGDAIGQTYKVVSISPTAIEFTYLPLMQRQSLALAP